MKITKGLTQAQQEDLNSYLGLDKTFDANPTKRDVFKPIKMEALLLKANIASINNAIINKLVDSTDDTAEKNSLKLKAATFWGNINSLTLGFALKYDFADLAKITKQSASHLMEIPDPNFQPNIYVLSEAIEGYLADDNFKDYNITLVLLDKGRKMAKDFQTFLGTNKHTEGKSIVATDEMERLFLPTKSNYTQFGLLSEYFSPDGLLPDEDFYKAIKSGLIIVHSSTHTIFDGHIFHFGSLNGINNVQIKNLNNGRMVMSDLLGYFKMEKFMGGPIQFEISAPGYITQTIIVEIKRAKHLSVDYQLKSIA